MGRLTPEEWIDAKRAEGFQIDDPLQRRRCAPENTRETVKTTSKVPDLATPVRTTTITIPFPPSINHYWRRVGKKTLLSAAGRKFKKAVEKAALECGCSHVDGRLDVDIRLFPPDRRRRDIDNYCKATLDALEKCGIYDNDEQIDHLRVRRDEVRKGGQAVIVIKRVG